MKVEIEFHPSDWKQPQLESVAESVALYIFKYKRSIEDLNSFMRVSGDWWRKDIHKSMFQRWISAFIPNRKKVAADKLEFADLLEEVMDVCETVEQWEKMRGLIPEKIFEKYFSEKHKFATTGFGVVVAINQAKVLYRPEVITDGDGNRQTVDAGSWNGHYGEFVEVKFQPEGFKEKEFGYLRLLENRLDKAGADHQIFLVAFDDPDFMKRQLIYKGYLKEDTRFKLLGHQDIIS